MQVPAAYVNLLKGPDLLPLGLLNQRLRHTIASFPSSYQILPTYACLTDREAAVDVWSDESWVSSERRPLLRDAREFRREFAALDRASCMHLRLWRANCHERSGAAGSSRRFCDGGLRRVRLG